MADKIIIPMSELLGGIAPTEALASQKPQTADLLDMRALGGLFERVGFTALGTNVTSSPQTAKLFNFDGDLHIEDSVDGFAWLDKELLVHEGQLGKLVHRNLSTTSYNLVAGKTFDVYGMLVTCNYPEDGAIAIHRPGEIEVSTFSTEPPAGIVSPIDTSNAHPMGWLLASCEGIEEVYRALAHDDGVLVLGSTGVCYFSITRETTSGGGSKQRNLKVPGLLNPEACDGDYRKAFFVGSDKNLWVVEKGQAKKLGFNYLWRSYSSAKLSYVSEVDDLFITFDDDEACFLLNRGLSRITKMVQSAVYVSDVGEIILDESGNTWTMNIPTIGETTEYDWEAWDRETDPPDRDPDLVTGWSDFGVLNDKRCDGTAVSAFPFWPMFVELEFWANTASSTTTVDNVMTSMVPVGELGVDFTRFRIKFWFPTYADAGAVKINGLMAHMDSADLRDIYATNQAASL